MKNIIQSFVGRSAVIVFAGTVFAVSISATPASANFFKDALECFPLPVCSDNLPKHPSLPIIGCPPLIPCDNDSSRRDYDNNRDYGYSTGRSGYAEPSTVNPAPVTPAPAPVTNTNTNTNTVIVNGGGSGYSYPVYVESPRYYPSYDYGYYPTYTYPQYQPMAPVQVTCSANTLYAGIGNEVVWSAFASGGNGYYTYSWSGTENLFSQGSQARRGYAFPGEKRAYVTVYSNGMSASAYCAPITVGGPVYQAVAVQVPPVYQPAPRYPQGPSLDIACYVTPTKARVGQAVTWTADVRGSYGPVSISWTGTDGLTNAGTGANSVTKVYNTPGAKKATITATSNGITTTRNCGATVSVTSGATVKVTPQTQASPTPEVTPDTQTSTALFSLAYVPWGWVAFLVILILFIAVIYLLFNRLKI